MQLAKNFIDIALQTNNRDSMLDFYRTRIGLPFEETLPLGGGRQQHRHSLNGSILKINHARDGYPAAPPSGYRELIIAKDITTAESLTDPDGNRLRLVPRGLDGVDHIGVGMTVSSLADFQHFYRQVLQIEEIDSTTFRWGSTLFFLQEDPNLETAADMNGTGFRYITVQVRNVDDEHAGVLSRGGSEGRPPITLGKVARISFIRDPDCNWIEVSQRASLTGDLPA